MIPNSTFLASLWRNKLILLSFVVIFSVGLRRENIKWKRTTTKNSIDCVVHNFARWPNVHCTREVCCWIVYIIAYIEQYIMPNTNWIWHTRTYRIGRSVHFNRVSTEFSLSTGATAPNGCAHWEPHAHHHNLTITYLFSLLVRYSH